MMATLSEKILIGDIRNPPPGLLNFGAGAIILDPPWPYDNQRARKDGGYQYDPMTIEEIHAIPVRSFTAPNCAVYLWGTWPKLPYVLECFNQWGVKYVTGFPWVKLTKDGSRPVYRIGHWAAMCSEYVFIGKIGAVSPPPSPKYLGLVGPSFQHSRKPNSIHEMIEDEKLKGPYLEIFARYSRPGWLTFGNEIEDQKGDLHTVNGTIRRRQERLL